MKILVCGGRDFDDTGAVWYALDVAHKRKPITLVIQGGAKGADSAAAGWAADKGIHYAEVPALWEAHGKAAGPLRNRAMLLLQPDGVIAFPGGRGTADMVEVAEAAGVKVWKPAA